MDPADGPRRRAGAAAGRRDDRAGADQGGAAGRAGGAAGGDADGRGEAADRLLAEQRRPGGAAVRAGPGPVHAAPDRGGVRRGEGGGRAGAVRGAELGGLAPPHDAVAAGAVVPDPGADRGSGGKTPAVTVSQVREIFTRLLRSPAPSPERIAEVVTPGAVAEGGGADLQVAQGDRRVPAPPPATGHELNSCASA